MHFYVEFMKAFCVLPTVVAYMFGQRIRFAHLLEFTILSSEYLKWYDIWTTHLANMLTDYVRHIFIWLKITKYRNVMTLIQQTQSANFHFTAEFYYYELLNLKFLIWISIDQIIYFVKTRNVYYLLHCFYFLFSIFYICHWELSTDSYAVNIVRRNVESLNIYRWFKIWNAFRLQLKLTLFDLNKTRINW